jgi:hypothetical protein
MDINRFAADEKLEIEGVWFDDFGDDTRMRIAADGNPKHQEILDRLVRPHLKELRIDDASDDYVSSRASELDKKLTIEAAAEGILLDWENVTNNGEPFPYNRKNAILFLSNRRLRQAVMNRARNLANYQQEVGDAAGKDSVTSLSGTTASPRKMRRGSKRSNRKSPASRRKS